uniref:REST corepressor 2 n=1 Tax=Macrostomum lignano TaxID=282301 RepID=A0A1I8J1Z6_9PLAT
MRVGRDYQATPPALLGQPGSRCNSPDGAFCVWSPPPSSAATEAQLTALVDLARDRYGYSAEQALAMLYWHKHNIELATADLPNFVPFPDEWTHEEKLVFEQAFNFQGKQFSKIAHALPDKSVPHLVKYYYQWKKSRSKSTALDKRRASRGEGGVGGRGGDSDSESSLSDSELPRLPPGCGRVRAKQPPSQQRRRSSPPKAAQPRPPHRPTRRRRIPHAIFLDYEALLTMSQQSLAENEAIVTALDNRLVTARTQVQRNRAELAQRWSSLVAEAEAFQEPRTEAPISCKWTEDELLLAVQGVRRYGKDFRAIAQLVGTKNEQHVRYFFAQYRSKFSLDSVLAEFCKEAAAASAHPDEAGGSAS